jgi:hypothetical protein
MDQAEPYNMMTGFEIFKSNGSIILAPLCRFYKGDLLRKVFIKLIEKGSSVGNVWRQTNDSQILTHFMKRVIYEIHQTHHQMVRLPANARLNWFPNHSDGEKFMFRIVDEKGNRLLSFYATHTGIVPESVFLSL